MSKPRILIVDDETAILELLETILGREGFDVKGVTTARDFRLLLEQENFDLFIVDLTLPDGNGLNLIRELRAITQAGVIVLTGRETELDQVLGLEIGADDYITKPFRQRELTARVNAVLRRTSAVHRIVPTLPTVSAPAPVRIAQNQLIDHEFDGYKVSASSRQIWNPDGEELELTTAEFSVLLALLECRGRVISRDQIMTLAKGRDWESYDRAIDGLVSRLRRKIPKLGGSTHYIRTVHGIGYIFSV